jgi:hypothetical protein
VPLVEQHRDSRPESCEVCRYLQTHPQLDRLLQHTLTMFAGWMLFEELESSASLSLRSIYVEQFAADSPGRPAPMEPEHWTLALLAAPEIKLTMQGAETRQ